MTSELPDEFLQRLRTGRILVEVYSCLLTQNQTEERFEDAATGLAFTRFVTGVADKEPTWHERLNALRELICENVQRVETRVTICAYLLHGNRCLGQTNLRYSRRFTFTD